MMKRKMVKFEFSYWKPEKEMDSVEGTYLGFTSQQKEFDGRNYTAFEYTIEQEDKKLIKVNGNKMINDFFSHLPFKTWIQLVYLGEKEGRNGTYKTFDMFHEELKEGYVQPVEVLNTNPEKTKKEESEEDIPF